MKPAVNRVFTWLALAAIAFVVGGCVGFAVSGYGETPVYGGYGYVGPWDRGRVEVEGGYFVAPPYGRSDWGRRDEDSRHREEVAPQRSAPVQRTAPRAIPSIPNTPRPAHQREGKDQR